MPPRSLLEKIPVQCEAIIAEDRFIAPTRHFPASIPPAEQARLTSEIEHAVETGILPSYRRFAAFVAFVAGDYAPHGRALPGLSSLPNGQALYQNAIREETTETLTAADIHALGLREVARITVLMSALARQAGYTDIAAYRTALRMDPRYVPRSPNQIIDDFRRYIGQMQPRLPELSACCPGRR